MIGAKICEEIPVLRFLKEAFLIQSAKRNSNQARKKHRKLRKMFEFIWEKQGSEWAILLFTLPKHLS
jgi:hypothetical protein